MATRPRLFRQADLSRALKGARAAGLNPTRAEIAADGRIVVCFDEAEKCPATEFDQWKSRRDARSP